MKVEIEDSQRAIKKAAALMGCEPEDVDDFVEAVRLLTVEVSQLREKWRDTADAETARCVRVEMERDALKAEVEREKAKFEFWRPAIAHARGLTEERDALAADNARLRAVLTEIASVSEGPIVNAGFDCPYHATLAREALEKKP